MMRVFAILPRKNFISPVKALSQNQIAPLSSSICPTHGGQIAKALATRIFATPGAQKKEQSTFSNKFGLIQGERAPSRKFPAAKQGGFFCRARG